MHSVLAEFFRQHHQHAPWWHEMQIKRLRISPGLSFSVSILPSLPPPLTRVSTTGSQEINNFAGFQKSFAHSSNQQSTCPEWKTIQSETTFGVVDTRPFLCVMPSNLSTTERGKRKRLTDSLAIESPIWWVSKMICQLQPSNPTNQLAF